MRPREGFSPTTPQHEAGTRIDPPPCGPSSSFVASLNPLSACYNFVLSLPRPLTQIKTRPPRSAMLGNRADHGQKPREEGGRDYPLKLRPELGLARSGLTSFWNDLDELAEILRSLHAQPTRGAVRLGVDEGYTRRCLPDILARFAVTHPQTTVEVSRAASCELVPRLKAGELDLMLCGLEPRQWPAVEVWRGPLAWIIADAQSRHRDDPLPLSLSSGNCPFRPPWVEPAQAGAELGRSIPLRCGYGLKRLIDLPLAWPDQWRTLGLATPARA